MKKYFYPHGNSDWYRMSTYLNFLFAHRETSTGCEALPENPGNGGRRK